MVDNQKQDDHKIAMLLDIDNFYGEREGRLGPWLKFLVAAALPVLLYAYTGFVIPAWLFWPFEVVFAVRMGLIFVGREKERLVQFRRQAADDFNSADELLYVRAIHPDGCIEYVNGMCAYCIIANNGTIYDDILHAKGVQDFMSLFGDCDFDVYLQNITDVQSLEERYNNVKLFVDGDAAKDFIDIIDHNRKVVYSRSLLQRTVFVLKTRKAYFTDIRDAAKQAVYSATARVFKEVHIATPEEVQELIDLDIHGVVNLDATLQKKYATHQYYGSRVLYFGDEPEQKTDKSVEQEERGFLITDEQDSDSGQRTRRRNNP